MGVYCLVRAVPRRVRGLALNVVVLMVLRAPGLGPSLETGQAVDSNPREAAWKQKLYGIM